jgi:hypothetical protein
MKRTILLTFSLLLQFPFLVAQFSLHISDSANLSCHGAMDGTATVSFSGGTAPYEILWNDDSLTTDATVTNLSAGRWYRVSVIDATDTTLTDSVILSEPDEIVYEIEGLKTIQCYGPAAGYLKITSGGGSGPHTYTWSGEINSASDSIYNLTAGVYYYQVTDSTGCSVNDSLVLTEAETVEISIDSIVANPCLGMQMGEIYVSAEGGVEPYEYLWSGPSNFSSQLQNITGLKEGMYRLDLTDARGCTYEKDTSIVDGDPITVYHSASEYGSYNLLCHGDSSGSIRVDTISGNGLDWKNYTYIWTGPSGYKAYEHEINNLVAGNYHLNVFDSVNCRSDVTVTLSQPSPILISYDSVVSNPCIDDTNSAIYISASGGIEPFSYYWSGPGGFTSGEKDIMNLSKGRYFIRVEDKDGCISHSDTSLNQVDSIDMVVAISEYGEYNISCHGSVDGFIKIQSVAGYGDLSGFTFLTTGPDGFSSPFRFITSGVKAGNYTIKITDPLGCSGEKDVVLTEPPKIQTGNISGATTFVHDSNYVYRVEDDSDPSTYAWSVEGGEIWSGQGSKAVEIEWRTSLKGRVKVIETSENGCTGDTVYLQTSFLTLSVADFPCPPVNIYPNPAVGNLYITGLSHYDGTVEFYSLLGRMVLRLELSNEVSLRTLGDGVYYIRVLDRSGQLLLTHKIIKK